VRIATRDGGGLELGQVADGCKPGLNLLPCVFFERFLYWFISFLQIVSNEKSMYVEVIGTRCLFPFVWIQQPNSYYRYILGQILIIRAKNDWPGWIPSRMLPNH
jgi:hypothetical protein